MRIPVLAFLLALSSSASALAPTGKTYPIAEPDALQEIQQRSSQVDTRKVMADFDISKAIKPYPLPHSRTTRVRYHIPWYTSDIDVPDKDGNIIYPKGYRFNPLEYVHYPRRIIVATAGQFDAMKADLRPSDMLIMTEGDYTKANDSLPQAVFVLDELVRSRLDIQVVPSVIEQHGKTFKVLEIEAETLSGIPAI